MFSAHCVIMSLGLCVDAAEGTHTCCCMCRPADMPRSLLGSSSHNIGQSTRIRVLQMYARARLGAVVCPHSRHHEAADNSCRSALYYTSTHTLRGGPTASCQTSTQRQRRRLVISGERSMTFGSDRLTPFTER